MSIIKQVKPCSELFVTKIEMWHCVAHHNTTCAHRETDVNNVLLKKKPHNYFLYSKNKTSYFYRGNIKVLMLPSIQPNLLIEAKFI